MAERAIREVDGKRILHQHLSEYSDGKITLPKRFAQVKSDGKGGIDFDAVVAANPWLLEDGVKLVAKPDQLIKRRGKGGLLLLNATWDDAKAWTAERADKDVTVESVTGKLNTFLVEEFVPHKQEDEVYLCIQSDRSGEEILFHHEVRQVNPSRSHVELARDFGDRISGIT